MKTARQKVKELLTDVLTEFGYGKFLPVALMRLDRLDDFSLQKIVNRVSQTIKRW